MDNKTILLDDSFGEQLFLGTKSELWTLKLKYWRFRKLASPLMFFLSLKFEFEIEISGKKTGKSN